MCKDVMQMVRYQLTHPAVDLANMIPGQLNIFDYGASERKTVKISWRAVANRQM